MDRKADSSRSSDNLHALLQLKTWEKPDAAFWDDFDRALERKKLQALVTAKAVRPRTARWIPATRLSALAALLLLTTWLIFPGEEPAAELTFAAHQAEVNPALHADYTLGEEEGFGLFSDLAAIFEEWPAEAEWRPWGPEMLFVLDKISQWTIVDGETPFATDLRQDRVEWEPSWDSEVALTTFSRSGEFNQAVTPSRRSHMSF